MLFHRIGTLSYVFNATIVLLILIVSPRFTFANTEELALRFAVHDTLPFGYRDTNGVPRGTIVDIAKLISTETGIPINIDLVPVSRVVREMKTGNADLTILLDRANSVDSIEQVGLVENTRTVLTRLRNDKAFDDSHLNEKKFSLGFVRGAFYGKEFDTFLENKKVLPIQLVNAQVGVDMLLRGRIDYLASLEISLAHALLSQVKNERIEPVKFFKAYNSALYISSRTKNKETVKDSLAKALVSLNEKGLIHPIHQNLKINDTSFGAGHKYPN